MDTERLALNIRPITPDDAALLQCGFARLSAESRYLRFHGAMPKLSERMLHHLTHVDGRNHVALVAVDSADPARGIGVARFVRDRERPHLAEIAVTVIDEAQGQGVGSSLLVELAERARALGIHAFSANVLPSNRRVARWLVSLGATVVNRDGGAVTFQLPVAVLEAVAA
jgi:GNAT superfamily N-acetyltransferase